MKNKLVLLKSEISTDREKIERLFEKFTISWEKYREQGEYAYLVETAFYANQIYSGFERLFKNIANSFENNIDEKSWHKSLLDRMCITVEGIRPAFVSGSNFKYLDELRSFRHFFRHSYDLDLDKEKFAIVASRALKLKDNYKTDIDKFLDFINRLLKE